MRARTLPTPCAVTTCAAKPSETLNCLAMSGMAGTMIPRPKLMSVDGRKTWKMAVSLELPTYSLQAPLWRGVDGPGW